MNNALSIVGKEYVIERGEHFRLFDGLSTNQKLRLLTKEKGLDPEKYKQVWEEKQKQTVQIFEKRVQKDEELIDCFTQLRDSSYKIAIASNSIRATVKLVLSRLGLLNLVDYYASNEDVSRKKPHPEIYWKCMAHTGAIPDHTVILEDSPVGQEGALSSKCHLIPIADRSEVNRGLIALIEKALNGELKPAPWKSNSLNVLVPMAGLGSRFVAQGYTFPKPLIMIKNKSMIQVVVDNLNIEANFIFIVQEEHCKKYHLDYFLPLIAPGCKILVADQPTEGVACTTLLAREFINSEKPLLIANSDQFIKWNSSETMYTFTNDSSDGSIITFHSTHPKWSYAKLGEDGYVSEVAEKLVISRHATVGIYFWKRGSDYVRCAEQMIAKNKRVNNEFYVCPVFNEAIEAGLKIRIKEIGPDDMWSLGTPEDLNVFLSLYKGKL